MNSDNSVLLIFTGGTIGMTSDPKRVRSDRRFRIQKIDA